jgi:hypothetical protein
MKTDHRSETIAFRVASSIPGRVRIQYAASRNADVVLRTATEQLAVLPYVTRTEVIRDARSIVLQYESESATPYEVLRDVDHALNGHRDIASRNGKARSESVRNGRSHGRSNGHANSQPNGPRTVIMEGRYPVGLSVLHAIPGRLRLQLDRLHFNHGTSDRLHEKVSAQNGIQSVEVEPDSGSLIVRYDPGVHHPAGVVRLVRRMLRLSNKPRPTAEVIRARDFLKEEPAELNPLVVPTVAVGLAALSGVRAC